MDQLKSAERSASALVENARKERIDRMKEARTEAEATIASYKAEMELAYQLKASAQTDTHGTTGVALDSTTMQEIKELEDDYAKNSERVERFMVDLVTQVEIVPPTRKA